MDFSTLETERLILRPLAASDTGHIAFFVGDERVARNTSSIPHPYPPGAAEAFLASLEGSKTLTWGIMPKLPDRDSLIGVISLREDGELGYWLGVPFWAAGYGSEALGAVVAAARKMGRETLWARVFQDNPVSARILVKQGFDYTGDAENYSIARQATVPEWRYKLDLAAKPEPLLEAQSGLE